MTQQLEHGWVKEIFTPAELKQYVTFETEWKNNATPDQKASFEKSWRELVDHIHANLNHSPHSEAGIAIGKQCMVLINGVYGKKYAHLRTKKFEKGFAEGKGLEEVGLNPEMVVWLDKAIDAYWHDRIYTLLNQVGMETSDKLLALWQEVLEDMYGEDNQRKQELYVIALADEKISQKAKDWLKKIRSE